MVVRPVFIASANMLFFPFVYFRLRYIHRFSLRMFLLASSLSTSFTFFCIQYIWFVFQFMAEFYGTKPSHYQEFADYAPYSDIDWKAVYCVPFLVLERLFCYLFAILSSSLFIYKWHIACDYVMGFYTSTFALDSQETLSECRKKYYTPTAKLSNCEK